jgi:NAD(P)-dependent dehydrogenase (short-subunit alcohol dehydrogenase family)
MDRLSGKTAVITGGGSGLGREGALTFAREGANVVVMDRVPGRAKAVSEQIVEAGGASVFYDGDVGIESDMSAAVELAVSTYGGLDIMWANAGHSTLSLHSHQIEEVSAEEWSDVLSTNLTGALWSAKYAVPHLKKRGGGSILFTGSSTAIRAMPLVHIYGATKGAVNALTINLARDLGPFGIRVNCLNPFFGMSINFMLDREAEVVGKSYEAAAPWNPDGHASPLKLPYPPEIADNVNYALFLVSDEARYVSGQCVNTTDGATANNVAVTFGDNWIDHLVGPSKD